MNEEFDNMVIKAVKDQQQAQELLEKLVAVAQPGAVYGEPIISGDYTVITASEVSVGMGVGYGMGGGSAPEAEEGETANQGEGARGFGGGGGGGGFSAGRPVAVISIGPDGVRVEPVRDVTKIALAFLTAAGSMLMMRSRMRAASRR
ncbi:MAG: spore germination protein GerW family protein [Anaerolineae bacterium]|jgi:uncharacterized spore protein YtfJ